LDRDCACIYNSQDVVCVDSGTIGGCYHTFARQVVSTKGIWGGIGTISRYRKIVSGEYYYCGEEFKVRGGQEIPLKIRIEVRIKCMSW
jgi:hypothetical protein